ncbi:MAG: hypothetical protein AAGH68_03990 [Pseudomonadota bacterium]
MSEDRKTNPPTVLDDTDLDRTQGGFAFEKIILTYDGDSDASLTGPHHTGPAMDGILLEVRGSEPGNE